MLPSSSCDVSSQSEEAPRTSHEEQISYEDGTLQESIDLATADFVSPFDSADTHDLQTPATILTTASRSQQAPSAGATTLQRSTPQSGQHTTSLRSLRTLGDSEPGAIGRPELCGPRGVNAVVEGNGGAGHSPSRMPPACSVSFPVLESPDLMPATSSHRGHVCGDAEASAPLIDTIAEQPHRRSLTPARIQYLSRAALATEVAMVSVGSSTESFAETVVLDAPTADGDEGGPWCPVCVCVCDVSLVVTPIRCWPRRKTTLLDCVSGYFPPGSLTCVLSVKERYANAAVSAMTGTGPRRRGFSGSVLASGYSTESPQYRARVAYITSTDGVNLDATVKANLLFSTRMQLAVAEGSPEEARRIARAAETTLLTRHLQSPARQLSRAQLYQLAIAMELVRDPAVVLLENPLLHFSLTELQTLLFVLRNLAENRYPFASPQVLSAGGPLSDDQRAAADPCARVVVLSTTDMPLPLYTAVSRLLLVSSSGKLLYSGPTRSIQRFFRDDLGVPNVRGEMIGDLLAQLEYSQSTEEVATKFRASALFRRLQEQLGDGDGIGGQASSSLGTTVSDAPQHVSTSPAIAYSALGAPTYREQLRRLTLFTLRRNFFSRAFVVSWVSVLAVCLVLSTTVALARRSLETDVQNRCGVLFLLLSCAMQVNTVFFEMEIAEYRSFLHMRRNSYLRVSQYVITTVLRLIIPRLGIAVLMALCSLVVLQSASLPLAILMALTSLVHAALMLLLVYWAPSISGTALGWRIIHGFYGYCVAFSGFIVTPESVPLFLQWTSLLRIGYGGLVATELRGYLFVEEDPRSAMEEDSLATSQEAQSWSSSPWDSHLSGGYNMLVEQYLTERGLEDDSWWRSALILLGVSTVLFILVTGSMYATSPYNRV